MGSHRRPPLQAAHPSRRAPSRRGAGRPYNSLDGTRAILLTRLGRFDEARALGRHDEAERWATLGAEAGASDDVITQALSRQVRAKALARRGDLAGAERLALEALALMEETGWVEERGDGLLDLAEVLAQAGKLVDAVARVEQALALWEADGNLVMAERARARLIDLGASADRVVSR